MWAVIALLALALIIVSARCIAYYATTLGLLYYLGTAHNDLLSEEKTRELRDYALQRRIREIAGKA